MKDNDFILRSKNFNIQFSSKFNSFYLEKIKSIKVNYFSYFINISLSEIDEIIQILEEAKKRIIK